MNLSKLTVLVSASIAAARSHGFPHVEEARAVCAAYRCALTGARYTDMSDGAAYSKCHASGCASCLQSTVGL